MDPLYNEATAVDGGADGAYLPPPAQQGEGEAVYRWVGGWKGVEGGMVGRRGEVGLIDTQRTHPLHPPHPHPLGSRRSRCTQVRPCPPRLPIHTPTHLPSPTGQAPDPHSLSRAVPIYASSSFVFRNHEHGARLFALEEFGNLYSR